MAITINTNISNPTYETYSIKSFNGVDYTTTPTNVEDSRAVDISNYLPSGETLVKRNGYETLDLWEIPYGAKVLGIWKYRDQKLLGYAYYEDKVYIDFKILNSQNKVDVNGTKVVFPNPIETTLKSVYEANLNVISVSEGLLIIGCGLFLVYEGIVIRPIQERSYIPTYLINLGSKFSPLTPRILEEVNLANDKFYVEIQVDLSREIQTFDFTEYFKSITDPIIKSVVREDRHFSIGSGVDVTYQYNGSILKFNFIKPSETEKTLRVRIKGSTTGLNYQELSDDLKRGLFTIKLQCTYTNSISGGSQRFELKDINTCTQAILYGVNKGDTLFIGGCPNFPNVDVHTAIPAYPISPIDNYTYFPSSSYQAFGDSTSAIVGYGILNNGDMIIVKESEGNKPNVYSRNAQYVDQTITYEIGVPKIDSTTNAFIVETTTKEVSYVDVRYPVFLTGCYVEATKNSKIIYYDNKIVINNKNGVYYISLNDSTATQTYGAYELSYNIRNNLKKVDNGFMVVFDDMLYVTRTSTNNDPTKIQRVYVADKDKYRFIDGKLQYEWWVLDDLEIINMFSYEDELYFTNEYGLYRFTKDTFIDDEKLKTKLVSVEGQGYQQNANVTITNGLNRLKVINHKINIDAVKSKNPLEYYKGLKKNLKFSFNNTEHIKYTLESTFVYNKSIFESLIGRPIETSGNVIIINNQVNEIYSRSSNYKNNYPFIWDYHGLYKLDLNPSEVIVYNNEYYYVYKVIYTFPTTLITESPYSSRGITEFTNDVGYIMPYNMEWDVLSILSSRYNLDDVYYEGDAWYDKDFNVIDKLEFNLFDIGVKTEQVSRAITRLVINIGTQNIVKDCILHLRKPIKSYWYSNYNHLGHLEYLKTSDYLYFVPDAKRGGYTRVGYKSSKKDVGYMSYSVGDTFDFNDVDFNDFTFGETEFGKTYSSKKKIKNFSFIQLKFYSNEPKDSTIAMVTFRFRYTKSNKGVR